MVDADALVGKPGVAECALEPTGRVMIDDVEYEALSLDGDLRRGTKIRVESHAVGEGGVRLRVRRR